MKGFFEIQEQHYISHASFFFLMMLISMCFLFSFPLVFQLFASSLSCLVVVFSEILPTAPRFLSFLLAHDVCYLNAPENNKSPELVIIFQRILLISKKEVTPPLRWGFKFQILTFPLRFFCGVSRNPSLGGSSMV